jgi:hypothetical protein
MVYITREMCGAEVESRGHLCPCVRVKGREWTLVEDANDDGALIEHKMCAICTRASKKQQKMDLKHGNGETYDYVFTLPAVYYRTLDMRDGEDARWVVAERMSEEEIRAFIERFNPGEQWERIVPHDLRQAVECTISQDEFGEGLSEVVDELFDLEPYSTERALRSSTTPKSIRESIALVGVGDHILENLIIASEKGEDGTEELEAAMAHIDIASPTLGDTVRTYGVSGGAGVSMRAQRILTITRSALEVAGSVVVANNVITGAEMDENGNDMSPAEESMKPSAGKDNAADDAALLLQAGLGDQDRHPETRSVPTPRKNLSKDFQTSGSGARGGEGKGGKRPAGNGSVATKRSPAIPSGKSGTSGKVSKGVKGVKEEKKGQKEGKMLGKKNVAVPKGGNKNNFWVVVGGRLAGGMVFDKFKDAKAMYEFADCQHRGLKTLDQCEAYLEDRCVDTGSTKVRAGVLYPYYRNEDGDESTGKEDGEDTDVQESEDEQELQGRGSNSNATAPATSDRLGKKNSAWQKEATDNGEGAGAGMTTDSGFPQVVGFWTVTAVNVSAEQEWGTILCRLPEVEAKCQEWARGPEAFEHDSMDLAITYLQMRGFPIPEPEKLNPAVYQNFCELQGKDRNRWTIEERVELAEAEWRYTGTLFTRQLPEVTPSEAVTKESGRDSDSLEAKRLDIKSQELAVEKLKLQLQLATLASAQNDDKLALTQAQVPVAKTLDTPDLKRLLADRSPQDEGRAVKKSAPSVPREVEVEEMNDEEEESILEDQLSKVRARRQARQPAGTGTSLETEAEITDESESGIGRDCTISPSLKDTIGAARTKMGLGLELPYQEDSELDRVAEELQEQAQAEQEQRRAEGAAKRAEAEQKAEAERVATHRKRRAEKAIAEAKAAEEERNSFHEDIRYWVVIGGKLGAGGMVFDDCQAAQYMRDGYRQGVWEGVQTLAQSRHLLEKYNLQVGENETEVGKFYSFGPAAEAQDGAATRVQQRVEETANEESIASLLVDAQSWMGESTRQQLEEQENGSNVEPLPVAQPVSSSAASQYYEGMACEPCCNESKAPPLVPVPKAVCTGLQDRTQQFIAQDHDAAAEKAAEEQEEYMEAEDEARGGEDAEEEQLDMAKTPAESPPPALNATDLQRMFAQNAVTVTDKVSHRLEPVMEEVSSMGARIGLLEAMAKELTRASKANAKDQRDVRNEREESKREESESEDEYEADPGGNDEPPRDYRASRELGKKRNEAGIHDLKGDQPEAAKLGLALLGNCEGRNLINDIEVRNHKVKDELELSAVVHGVIDTYQNDPKRTKKQYKDSTKSQAGWDYWRHGMEVSFKYGHRKLLIGTGGELEWLPSKRDSHMLKKESKAAAAYARMYYLLKGVDEFVQAHFAMGVVDDVLSYIYNTIWMDLREAERDCFFSRPAIMYRQIMVLDTFVNELGCIVPEEMWRYNLYGRNVSSMSKGHASGKAQGNSGSSDNSGNGGSKATGSGITKAEVERLIRDSKKTNTSTTPGGGGGGLGGGGGGGSSRYGIALPLPSWKSSATDIKGNPYKNLEGGAYMGSICDFCEVSGFSFRHHPLRCNRKFPNWMVSPPENDNEDVEFEVRGGKTATLKSESK